MGFHLRCGELSLNFKICVRCNDYSHFLENADVRDQMSRASLLVRKYVFQATRTTIQIKSQTDVLGDLKLQVFLENMFP